MVVLVCKPNSSLALFILSIVYGTFAGVDMIKESEGRKILELNIPK